MKCMMPTSMPRLVCGAVVLREFEKRDVGLSQAVADDPLIRIIASVPTSDTSGDGLEFIARQRRRLAAGEGYSFAIADGATDEAVGQIGLWLRDIGRGRASVGYWVGSRFRQRGYTTAALDLLTSWAIELDGVRRLQIEVEPWNEGSWRVAQACGYEREGLLRSWRKIGDQFRDMFMYSRIPARSPKSPDSCWKSSCLSSVGHSLTRTALQVLGCDHDNETTPAPPR